MNFKVLSVPRIQAISKLYVIMGESKLIILRTLGLAKLSVAEVGSRLDMREYLEWPSAQVFILIVY